MLMSNKPIRVLQIFICMDRSGVPVMLMNYYRNINRNLVQFDFAVESGKEEYFDKEIHSLGGVVYRIGMPGTGFGYYRKLAGIINKGNYTIVHSHMNYRNLPILTTALICGVKNRVSHSHNAYVFHGLLKKVMRKTATLLLNTVSTKLLTCSELAGKILYGKRAADKGVVKVINNAIDVQKYGYNEAIRRKLRNDMGLGEKIVWGHVGNLGKLKNHLYLIDAFAEFNKRYKQSKLVLVGKGSLFDKINSRALEKGIENNVIFLGSRSDVQDLYQIFDLFVLPSISEGFAIVLLEAQASGLKCLVSDSLSDEMNVAGLMTQLSLSLEPEIWAEKAGELIAGNEERKSFVTELAKQGYDIEKEAHTLEKIYLEMKGKNGER